MLKEIQIHLEVVESMLYYWSAVADREKVSEQFFVDISEMPPMPKMYSENFTPESVRKVLSSVQNRELLSDATQEEKRFWNNNMWMMEDLTLPLKMADPVKKLNLTSFIEEINREYPNFPYETIQIYFTPLHVQEYEVFDNELVINFYKIMSDWEGNIHMNGKTVEEYVKELIIENFAK